MSTFTSVKPTLITTAAYPEVLVRTIDQAKERIMIVTTTFRADDERMEAISDALIRAADRGVAVSICADVFTYMEPKKAPFRFAKHQSARALKAIRLERKFKKHGATFYWLGRKSNIILSGRTHSKWVLVDNNVFAFGGINLDRESLDNTDFMLHYDDAHLADHIALEHADVMRADRKGGSLRSTSFRLDDETSVLIDGGFPGNSIIYRHAMKLAIEAKSIVLVSQYCPTGPLNRILKLKNATLYFNHWRKASTVNRWMIRFGMLRSKQETLYKRESYLHSKFIIFEMPDGHKTAITGSHNFMMASGLVGTREIALETSDPEIISQLEQFRRDHVE